MLESTPCLLQSLMQCLPEMRGNNDVECRSRLHLTKTRTADGTVMITPRMATVNSADAAIGIRLDKCNPGCVEV